MLELAGITLVETPSTKEGDFMTHVDLTFTSEEQAREFEMRRQNALREESVNKNTQARDS